MEIIYWNCPYKDFELNIKNVKDEYHCMHPLNQDNFLCLLDNKKSTANCKYLDIKNDYKFFTP